MIKVNLLNTRVAGDGEVDFDQPIDPGQFNFGGPSPDDTKLAAAKIGLMLLFTIALMFYESFNMSSLREEATKLSAQANQLRAEVSKGKAENEKALETQKEIKELESRIELMKELGEKRMRELKALDHLQSIIPKQLWFKEVKYKEQQFDITGYAVSDDDLTDFLQGLEKQSYFSDVVLEQAIEVKNQTGFLKQFKITAVLGDIE
jgi:Tfp pilus assembly protein PilN